MKKNVIMKMNLLQAHAPEVNPEACEPSDDPTTGVDGFTYPDTNNIDCEVIEMTSFDLAVDKSILSEGPYMVGDTVQYQIRAKNESTLVTTDVVITDVLPVGLTMTGTYTETSTNGTIVQVSTTSPLMWTI